MRHIFTALVAAIEAVMIALAGIAAIALPVLLVGIVTFSLGVDFMTLGHVIAGVWVFAHARQLQVHLDESQSLALGLGAEPVSFTLTLAPLLLAILTAYLSWRLGRRFASNFVTGAAAVGGASVGFFGAAMVLTWFAGSFVVDPVWLTALKASLWCVVPGWVGLFSQHADRLSTAWFRAKVALEQAGAPKLGWGFETYVPRTVRLAVALFAVLVCVGAGAVTVALTVSFVDIVSLTQSLQLDVIGSFVFFLGQLAFLPTLIIWALAWLSGAGFMFGEGSSLTPFETLIGPLPGIPVLAALPEGSDTWGFMVVLVVVLAGMTLGVLFGDLPEYRKPPLWRVAIVVFCAVSLVGLSIAGMNVIASGAVGPERLLVAGPEVWIGAGLISAELFVGVMAGFALRRTHEADELPRSEWSGPEYVELASAPAHPRAAVRHEPEHEQETVPIDELASGLHDAEPMPALDETVDDDAQDTEVISRFSKLSRIANPDDEQAQPWFRRAASPRKRTSKNQRPSPEMFTEDELLEEFSWESRPDEDPENS